MVYRTMLALGLQFTGRWMSRGVAYRTVHALGLQFTGSATPLDVHLTSRPSTVLAVIEGLGTRLPGNHTELVWSHS